MKCFLLRTNRSREAFIATSILSLSKWRGHKTYYNRRVPLRLHSGVIPASTALQLDGHILVSGVPFATLKGSMDATV